MENDERMALAAELTQRIIKELKADIRAGKVSDPRLILYFGGDDDATKN